LHLGADRLGDLVIGGRFLAAGGVGAVVRVAARAARNVGRRGGLAGTFGGTLLAVLVGGGLRADHLAVGIELLFLVGHPRHVDVGRHVHAGLAGADDAFDHRLHLLGDALLDLGLAAVGLGGHARIAAGQGLGVLVDDRDAVGLQVGHRAGH